MKVISQFANPHTPTSTFETFPFELLLLVAHASDEGIDPGVDDEVNAGRLSGGSDFGQERGLPLGVDQHAAAVMIRVLEIAADDPGAEQTADELRRIEPIAGLDVGGYRTTDGPGDPSDEVEDEVWIARVVVPFAEHIGDGAT